MPISPLRRAAASAACLGILACVCPRGATAQLAPEPRTSHAELLATNTLLGGLTGGVSALLRGEPVVEGFVTGAAGGGLVYAGKRLAGEGWSGSGLIGRQIASVGSSLIGNAAAGRGPLDRVALGLGPVHVYIGRERPAAWRLDAAGTGLLLWGLLSDGIELRLTESISTGAVVFHSERGDEFAGPGIIFFHRGADPERREYVLAHEIVHILHFDQTYLSWSDPVESWLASGSPAARAIHRHVELNVIGFGIGILGTRRWEHRDRPWEIEAMFLARD